MEHYGVQNRIADEARHLDYPISVVGIPKTIDNDIMFTDKSFGYQTACGAAVEAIKLRMRKRVPSPMGSGLLN